jgi:hypothetical protein
MHQTTQRKKAGCLKQLLLVRAMDMDEYLVSPSTKAMAAKKGVSVRFIQSEGLIAPACGSDLIGQQPSSLQMAPVTELVAAQVAKIGKLNSTYWIAFF